MTSEQWATIKHFTINENWGNPDKMDYGLLLMLDKYREAINKPIIIHCGYAQDGHTVNSMHYKGQAVDCHVMHADLLDLYLVAKHLNFGGTGIYRWGIHLDNRSELAKQWCCIDDIYLPLTADHVEMLRVRYAEEYK